MAETLGRVSDDHVTVVSLFCVPLITLPDVTPLLEALLTYHGGGSQEVLSSEFLEAVNETFLKVANYSALLANYDYSDYSKIQELMEDLPEHKRPQLNAIINEGQLIACTTLQASMNVADNHNSCGYEKNPKRTTAKSGGPPLR
ncbi:Fanconi anemia group C protein like protein [Chelonia mydas]|uniref:Fanconi anemia group C protein like protein n=1 Tax=Chelonia mydas TaxID=8469 RepID=M7BU74_CHEMY|nr:Fanconi anemia group C protein like protein [Chelonia mydas]